MAAGPQHGIAETESVAAATSSAPAAVKPDIVTFWHGGPPHRIHRMCLASQVKRGFRVTLYSYAPVPGLPPGVENADAAAVLPLAFLARLRTRLPGVSNDWAVYQLSDLIRMRLQEMQRGLWLDTDVFLFRDFRIDPTQPFFAWESRRFIGNAVLYLPPTHPILLDFARLWNEDSFLADWLPARLRARSLLWRALGRPHGVHDLNIMVYGPLALTMLARRHGCVEAALPLERFQKWARTDRFFEPDDVNATLDDPQVLGMHIHRKARRDEPAAPGSLYAWALRDVAEIMAPAHPP